MSHYVDAAGRRWIDCPLHGRQVGFFYPTIGGGGVVKCSAFRDRYAPHPWCTYAERLSTATAAPEVAS